MHAIREPAERARAGRPRPLLTLVALFALLLQAFEVQTHVHAYGAPPAYFAASNIAHAADQQASTPQQHLLCVVCQSFAATGAALAPASAAPDVVPPILREADPTTAADAPRAPAHAWRSRAPPIFL